VVTGHTILFRVALVLIHIVVPYIMPIIKYVKDGVDRHFFLVGITKQTIEQEQRYN